MRYSRRGYRTRARVVRRPRRMRVRRTLRQRIGYRF